MDTFNIFDNGRLALPGKTTDFNGLKWNAHPTFKGVSLKHIVTAQDTGGAFSYHLVKVEPGCKIGNHVHATQLETHEVIAGCDYVVRIPMAHGVDSLNVAAASAVAFWELRNR